MGSPTGCQSKSLQGIPGIPLQASDERDPSFDPLPLPQQTPVLLPRMAACTATYWAVVFTSPLRLTGACVKESESIST